jgi:transcriptional regulator with XRE-family HTH domain
MASPVGRNIRRIRKQSGYSQAHLAELARTSQSWICRIERGNENPSLASVTRIAGALQVDVLDLLRAPAGEAACDEPQGTRLGLALSGPHTRRAVGAPGTCGAGRRPWRTVFSFPRSARAHDRAQPAWRDQGPRRTGRPLGRPGARRAAALDGLPPAAAGPGEPRLEGREQHSPPEGGEQNATPNAVPQGLDGAGAEQGQSFRNAGCYT